MSKIRVFVVETDIQERTMLTAIQRLIVMVSQKSERRSPRSDQADPWEGKLQEWIPTQGEVTIDAALSQCLGLPVGGGRTQRDSARVGAILRKAGWRQVKKRVGQVRTIVFQPSTLDARQRVLRAQAAAASHGRTEVKTAEKRVVRPSKNKKRVRGK